MHAGARPTLTATIDAAFALVGLLNVVVTVSGHADVDVCSQVEARTILPGANQPRHTVGVLVTIALTGGASTKGARVWASRVSATLVLTIAAVWTAAVDGLFVWVLDLVGTVLLKTDVPIVVETELPPVERATQVRLTLGVRVAAPLPFPTEAPDAERG